jgi:putative PIN family toxin of toxin-antitoxin system
MDKEKIVVDTNILISALGWDGKPRALFMRILDGKHELILSRKQFIEIKRVLDYPKFGFSPEQKDCFLKILLRISALVETKIELDIIKEDYSDNMLLECAIEKKAKYIVSGDRHLRKLKNYKGVKILTASEFLKKA